MLAIQYLAQAKQVIGIEDLTPELVSLSIEMLREATRLDPENPDHLRTLLDVAILAERRDLKNESAAALLVLDPQDQRARLIDANARIDAHQTFSARVAAYESLLSGSERERLGDAVASRLAYDLALLHRREGNSDEFVHWLTEATVLDPSNKSAAAMAAGFFRMYVDDVFAETELLINLLLADPTDLQGQTILGSHLLDHGAYRGAERIYRLADSTARVNRNFTPDDLVADRALAIWGNGDPSRAFRIIRDHQAQRNQMLRTMVQRDRPDLTPLERAQMIVPLSPTLAAIRAALAVRLDDDQQTQHIRRISDATDQFVQRLTEDDELNDRERDERDREIALVSLNAAWTMLCLGGDLEQVERLLDQARSLRPLSERAEDRFRGWKALRDGDLTQAIEVLKRHRETDIASRLGLAEAQLVRGNRQQAAREFLSIVREQPGNLVGIWALDRLTELLGQRGSFSSTADELNALIASLPNAIDRVASEPRSLLSIQARPLQTRYQTYEPITVRFEVTNHAPFPLSVGRDAPIRSDLILMHRAQSATAQSTASVPPQVYSINRRLRLMPRETLRFDVDLRTGPLHGPLTYDSLSGLTLRTRSIVNFDLTSSGAPAPGVMGSDHETRPFRVDGRRITSAWLERSLQRFVESGPNDDLHEFARYSVAATIEPGSDAPEQQRNLIRSVRNQVVDESSNLPIEAQAWLLAVLPRSEVFEPIFDRARNSEDRTLFMSYLTFRVRDANNPIFDRASRHNDPSVRSYASTLRNAVLSAMESDETDLFEEIDRPSEPGAWGDQNVIEN
ncbi:MAG: hypothetical protein EA377_11960 [Phycisphaerales bacterium]|nr:MAG: hypothetical protein EA377_11960 [Phycisphaerales bacterium]